MRVCILKHAYVLTQTVDGELLPPLHMYVHTYLPASVRYLEHVRELRATSLMLIGIPHTAQLGELVADSAILGLVW